MCIRDSVKSGRILNVACNQARYTRLTAGMGYWTLHAEIAVCLGIDREMLIGGEIYNYRETRRREQASSMPCNLCRVKLRELGVNKIYFTEMDSVHWMIP